MNRRVPQGGSAYGEPEEPKEPDRLSLDERDQRIESRYLYDRRGERSTMVFVDVYRNELVREFFEWRADMTRQGIWQGEGVYEALRRWERSRFGTDLDVGAHGILRFWVSVSLSPDDGGRPIPPGYFDRTKRLVRPLPKTNAATIAARLTRGMEMPEAPSRAELDRQRRQLLSEAESQGETNEPI